MKKTILIIITLIICNLSFAEKIPIPDLKGPVTDLTYTLYDFQLKNIENKLMQFEQNNSGQIVVFMLPTTGEESIEEYSIRLAEKWKIGSAENDGGIILLIAKNDRKLRIEVGYGLEAIITDAEAQYIIDNKITPQLKSGDFYEGIDAGIDRIIGLISGVLPTVDEISEISTPENSSADNLIITLFIIIVLTMFVPYFLLKSKFWVMSLVIIGILGIQLLAGIISNDFSVAYAFMWATGFINIIPFLINLIGTLTGKKKYWNFSSGSSYSGGSYSSSSWSSSSSSSSSSYSGGGGSFGGGGASGSW
ncbi:MAG: TPM domain-containing protein [Bacteroidales bacterium]|nr:TPM domain-containing protein [Bacteroidales bacterium]